METHIQHEVESHFLQVSITKAMERLFRCMTSISIQQIDLDFVFALLKHSLRLTHTPGISVVPFMIHIAVSSAISQFFSLSLPPFRRFNEFTAVFQPSSLLPIPAASSSSFSSSSTSSDSYAPVEFIQWEIGRDGEAWKPLSRDDCDLLNELVRSDVGACVVRLQGTDKYLLDTHEFSLVHIHSGYLSFLFDVFF